MIPPARREQRSPRFRGGAAQCATLIAPYALPPDAAASTDVGDVSWNVPTIGFRTATFVPGVVAHTWQAAASAGMSIGQKGMIVAAKALAATGTDLFSDRQLVLDAKADFRRQIEGKTYQSVIPAGQKPPLNYRNK